MAVVEQTGSLATYPKNGAQAAQENKSRLYLIIFLICIFLPIARDVAGLRMSPTRIFLLISTVPLAFNCLSGKYGRTTMVDWIVMFHGLWIMLSLIAVHGTSKLPFAGITMVELTGGYFVGRAFIRNSDDYRFVFKFVLIVLAINSPLAMLESLTAKTVIPDLLRVAFETPTRDPSARGRIGLERVQGVFDHPILWGMFCSLTFANTIMSLRAPAGVRTGAIILSIWSTIISLSSGPMLAVLLQSCLLLWGKITKDSWKLCVLMAVIGYVVVDLISDRTPIRVLISYAAFNPLSAYTRLAQFDWGLLTIQNNPIFGIGLGDWARPHWVGASVDNFWLLTGMRYGILGFVSIFSAFVVHLWLGAHAKISDPDLHKLRIGHLVTLIAMCCVMITVHLWGNVSVFVVFYLGAGGWLYASALENDTDTETDEGEEGLSQGAQAEHAAGRSGPSMYTRFSPTKSRRGIAEKSVALPERTRAFEQRSRPTDIPDPRRHILPNVGETRDKPKDGDLWARDFSKEKPRK